MIGIITGVISLLAVGYTIGFKMATIESRVSTLDQNKVDRANFVVEKAKLSFVYDIVTEYALKGSTSESHQSSTNPVLNNPNPQIVIPQNFLSVIQRITKDNINKDVHSIVSLIMQELAAHQKHQMNTFIRDNNLTIAEFINLIAEKIVTLKKVYCFGGPWNSHLSTTTQDALNFINGKAPYTKPHAVVSIAATKEGFYLFYRDDLEGTSGWGYKLANTPEDAHNFLNRIGAYPGQPINKALLAYKAQRSLYLFYRGRSSKASWGWKRATNVKDMRNFINGAGVYGEPKEGTIGGLNPHEILMFYRVDLEGSKGWGWKLATKIEDAHNFLNGKGSYKKLVKEAKIFGTTRGHFYIFYKLE